MKEKKKKIEKVGNWDGKLFKSINMSLLQKKMRETSFHTYVIATISGAFYLMYLALAHTLTDLFSLTQHTFHFLSFLSIFSFPYRLFWNVFSSYPLITFLWLLYLWIFALCHFSVSKFTNFFFTIIFVQFFFLILLFSILFPTYNFNQ